MLVEDNIPRNIHLGKKLGRSKLMLGHGYEPVADCVSIILLSLKTALHSHSYSTNFSVFCPDSCGVA